MVEREADGQIVDITLPAAAAAGGGPGPGPQQPADSRTGPLLGASMSPPTTPVHSRLSALQLQVAPPTPSAPRSRLTSEQEVLIQSNVFLNQLVLIDNKINATARPGHGRKGSFLMPAVDEHVSAAPPSAFQRFVVQPCAIVFVTMELESSSPLAWMLSNLVMLVILLAIFATVVASEPTIMVAPATCAQPACNNNPKWCPGRMICAPQPPPIFDTIENVCIYFFTAEYGLKFFTCWSVSPRAAGILPKDDTVKALELAEDADDVAKVHYGPVAQTWRWVLRLKNLIDLACWLPFYIALALPNASASSTYVRAIRLLRLIRVFRLLNLLHMFEQMYAMTQLVIETLSSAWPVLAVFLFFSFMIIVLFGSIMYFVEAGTYTINTQYPTGAYIRLAVDRQATEVTPFTSIGAAFYYVIVTGATVGYGDLVPTTQIGRAIASVICLVGILGVAAPVGVLGSSFKRIYDKHFLKLKERIAAKKKRVSREAKSGKLSRQASARFPTRGSGKTDNLVRFSAKLVSNKSRVQPAPVMMSPIAEADQSSASPEQQQPRQRPVA